MRRLLAQARKQGYSIVHRELDTGVRSQAVSIFDRAGRAIAAMNVGGRASRTSRKGKIGRIPPALRAAADRITGTLVT